jgi:hypothetical protein
MRQLKKFYLRSPRQWTASGMAAAILVFALLGLGVIGKGSDFDMPHTSHSTYEPEPCLAVSIFASGNSTATMTASTSGLYAGLTPIIMPRNINL